MSEHNSTYASLLKPLCTINLSDGYNLPIEEILSRVKDIGKRNIDDMGLGEFDHAVLKRECDGLYNKRVYVFELWGKGEILWTESEVE